ncbi:hypothetical protein [Gordonia sp. FQ]|uniref:hypothetical protein n=1 Tax=Gordonia sp. FQ TaxID=3446634 RepID=UPI003F82C6FE
MTDEHSAGLARIGIIATVAIVAQAVVRGILVARGNFYWDDLILIGKASAHPILSWDYLGADHDGHFMPGAFLLAGITTVAAPVQWWLPAATLVVLQVLASLAVWRMIRTLAPTARLGAIVALAFYLFSPMTVSSFAWWAAGLNSLPMQAAMAVVVANAVLLVRRDPAVDERRRRVLTAGAIAAFVVALLFFEKSLFILPVAFVAAVLVTGREAGVGGGDYRDSALTVTARRARPLWLALTGVFAVWIVVYLSVSSATAGPHSLGQTGRLVWRSVNDAIVPSLVGGPWHWDRWLPSPPMGFPAVWMIVAGWVLLAAVVVWTWQTRRGGLAVWAAAALYAVGAQIPVMWNRSSPATALELAQTMRYLPDTALVIAIAIALVASAPTRGAHAPRAAATSRAPRVALAVGAVAVVASALVGTASFSASWRDDPTGDYLATAKKSLAQHRDLVMFDQALPLEVLTPVAYPNNQISRVFGRVRDRPRFGSVTDRLMVLDEAGAMVPGGVSPVREVPESGGTCASPALTGPTRLTLSGPLIEWKWTVALSYCADTDGEIGVRLDGDEVRVPVRTGLHPVYFQLSGGGHELVVRPLTPGLALHTGAGRVGEPIVAAYAP